MYKYGQRDVRFNLVLPAGGPLSIALDKTKVIHV